MGVSSLPLPGSFTPSLPRVAPAGGEGKTQRLSCQSGNGGNLRQFGANFPVVTPLTGFSVSSNSATCLPILAEASNLFRYVAVESAANPGGHHRHSPRDRGRITDGERVHPNQCRSIRVVIGIIAAEFGEICAGGGRKIGSCFVRHIGGRGFIKDVPKFAVPIVFLFFLAWLPAQHEATEYEICVCVQDSTCSSFLQTCLD